MHSLFLLFYSLGKDMIHIVFKQRLLETLFSCGIYAFPDKDRGFAELYRVRV